MGEANNFCILGWFVIVVVSTMSVAIYGYQMILKVEKAIAWITGIMTIIYIFFLIPHIDFSKVYIVEKEPSIGLFLGGMIMAMTMVGLGFLNYGGDFARYLPEKTKSKSIIFGQQLELRCRYLFY